jgi:hypothetical protein
MIAASANSKPMSAKLPVVKPTSLPKLAATAKATPAGDDDSWETI